MQSVALFASFEPILRFLAGILGPMPLNSVRSHLEKTELKRSGYCLGMTADEYLAISLTSGVILGTIAALFAKYSGAGMTLVVPCVAFGLVLPKIQVQEITRKRAKVITRGLPHSIEIAALCMGAGLDFPGALRMLVQAESNSDNPLTQEFGSILEELELGHTRRQALVNFAGRVRTPAVRDFVNAVVQAEQKGNPLARVLQVQGRMLNMRRSVAAEEAAARAGVLMMGPMVLLLACILLLLMGPFLVKGIGF